MRDEYEKIVKGELSIFAFGLGGAGKTTLGKVLSGKLNLGEVPSSYKLSLTTEKYPVSGRTFATLYVPPGQKGDKQRVYIPEIVQKMSAARRYLVINIVCYGYHSVAQLELNQNEIYRPGMTKDAFMKAFLPEMRSEEIVAFKKLLPHFEAAPGRLRLITLVTKQDLWWDNRKRVEEHYMNGEYGNLVSGLARYRGTHFDHSFVSCALNVLNFSTRDGQVLSKTTAGYDSTLWIANYNLVIEAIRSLLGSAS